MSELQAAPEASDREVLRGLELQITRKLDGLLHGQYQGLVPGHGSEPGDTRPYQAGDDVRRIDWNVTARLQDPHIRTTIADRELETRALVDLSPSLDFGTADCEKRDLVLAAAAAVGFITARSGNRFGALLAQGHQLRDVPARGGSDHLRAILHRIQSAERLETGSTALGPALRRLGATAGRAGLVVVISDFLATDDWPFALRRIGLEHQLLAIEVVDPRELELPAVGLVPLLDVETGAVREVNTADPALRARYAAAAAAQRSAIAEHLRAARAGHLQLRTDRDWLFDVVRFVTLQRRTRMARP
ncbi:MAG: DUF58 domain-containing protein [Acidimicrobiia bacterium]|nr:DUF58 domain-containing protein [Acidimicrobiia bacterium]MDH5236431.1 DUF58 domain-containing protein [Acidimicrobiia bacterium]